jgi:hypothetical protein
MGRLGFFRFWEREGAGKCRRINPFFPCFYVCRGRRRTMPFRTALFQGVFWRLGEFFFLNMENNPKIGYDNVHVVARVIGSLDFNVVYKTVFGSGFMRFDPHLINKLLIFSI